MRQSNLRAAGLGGGCAGLSVLASTTLPPPRPPAKSRLLADSVKGNIYRSDPFAF